MKEETIVEEPEYSEKEKIEDLAYSAAIIFMQAYDFYFPDAQYFVPIAFWEAMQEEIEAGRQYMYTEVITPDTVQYCVYKIEKIETRGWDSNVHLRSESGIEQKVESSIFIHGFLLPDPHDNIFIVGNQKHTEMLAKTILAIFLQIEGKREVKGRTLSANLKKTLEIAKRYPEKYYTDTMYAGYWSKIEGLKF
ncbi:MAG: hypothetical protein Q4C86_06210 [bacterium]|nr:hypothetical protein [bacterium]